VRYENGGSSPNCFSIDAKVPKHCNNLFCIFSKSVGHDEKECHAFDLMREHTMDAYIVQGEEGAEGGVP
jgi:hypothetical protein